MLFFNIATWVFVGILGLIIIFGLMAVSKMLALLRMNHHVKRFKEKIEQEINETVQTQMKYLTVIMLLVICLSAVLGITVIYNKHLKSINAVDAKAEAKIEWVLNLMYTTSPAEFKTKNKELEKEVDYSIWYKLNLESIDNTFQRTQPWSGVNTKLESKITAINSDEYLVKYNIINVTGEESVRFAHFKFDKDYKIIEFDEYTGTPSVEYMVDWLD